MYHVIDLLPLHVYHVIDLLPLHVYNVTHPQPLYVYNVIDLLPLHVYNVTHPQPLYVFNVIDLLPLHVYSVVDVEKSHRSAQELHTVHKQHRTTIDNNTMSGTQYYNSISHTVLHITCITSMMGLEASTFASTWVC